MKNNSLTLTMVANMTSNYGDSLGNVASVQKIFKNGDIYSMRSKESIKNAIMVKSGMYDDLEVEVDGATQKKVEENLNVSNCRALEGGYMNTNVGDEKFTYVRNSSFYLTDAIAIEPFINEPRFHNNLHLAKTYAKQNELNLQNESKKSGLMPYNYEYDKNLKIYSMTIDLEMIGKDENFNAEASNEEKSKRVNMLLEAVENLSLVVKGNLDNAEPIFIVGGLSKRKTHTFENMVRVKNKKIVITDDFKKRVSRGYSTGLLRTGIFENENEIENELNPISIFEFFDSIKAQVVEYYGK